MMKPFKARCRGGLDLSRLDVASTGHIDSEPRVARTIAVVHLSCSSICFGRNAKGRRSRSSARALGPRCPAWPRWWPQRQRSCSALPALRLATAHRFGSSRPGGPGRSCRGSDR